MLRMLFFSPSATFHLPLLLFRVALGVFFFSSGFNKLFVAEQQVLMLETLTEAGIPFAGIMASFVAGCEALFGLSLALGLFTRLSALFLLVISGVALLTVGVHHIPDGLNILTWYSWLFYLPEGGYILIALCLLIQGGGPWGLDQWIHRRLGKPPVNAAL